MHFVQAKSLLSSYNGINIYRGCSHGCIYCDSRSKCYNFSHNFEDIEIKQNAPELLEKALLKKRNKCMIGTGSMSDPYLHCEKQFELTKTCLQIIEKYGFGVSVLTKSDLIMRDIELLSSINKKSKAVCQITLTTSDDTLCKKIEPNVCPTSQRFKVLKEMQKEKIPTLVWLSPFLPFINDTKENLLALLEMCIDAKVKNIIFFGMGLTLRDGNREYFYKKLDELFAKENLKQKYIQTFGNRYEVLSPKNKELSEIAKKICHQNGINCNINKSFEYLKEFPSFKNSQLELF